MLRFVLVAVVSLCCACRNEGTSKKTEGQKVAKVSYYVCRYQNPFTHIDECREYRGAAFDEAAAKKACAKPFSGAVGTLSKIACPSEGAIGACSEGEGTAAYVVTWAYGGFRVVYSGACERFVKGKWSDEGHAPKAEPPMPLMEEARRALVSDADVVIEPKCDDDGALKKLVEARGQIWFRPRTGASEDALVLYPGAMVDPRAYAPYAYEIARRGVSVAIVPMESNLALTGIDRVRDVMKREPGIKHWFLAGHSMGGAMASRYAAHGEGREQLAGLILWAAFPSQEDNLFSATLPVLSIFGSEDGRTTVDEIETAKKLLPESTRYQRIEGGNHAQFGFYGSQEGDRTARISRGEQMERVVAATVAFIGSLRLPDRSASPP